MTEFNADVALGSSIGVPDDQAKAHSDMSNSVG